MNKVTNTTPFQSLSSSWLAARSQTVSPNVLSRYMNVLNTYLLPTFADTPVSAITPEKLTLFTNDLLTHGKQDGTGIAPGTVFLIISQMKQILAFGGVYPAVELRNPGGKKELRVLSAEEQGVLTGHLMGEPTGYHVGILLSLYMGLKIGEVCALKWEDFHLTTEPEMTDPTDPEDPEIIDGYIHVSKTMLRVQSQGLGTPAAADPSDHPAPESTEAARAFTTATAAEPDPFENQIIRAGSFSRRGRAAGNARSDTTILSSNVANTPLKLERRKNGTEKVKKTEVCIFPLASECQIRDIPIPEMILPLLDPGRSDFFLLTGKEKHMEPRTLINKFKKALDACGLERVSFDVLRDTFAVRCLELGFDVKSLSEILGHSTTSVTLNHYGRMMGRSGMDERKRNMNMLNQLMR